MLKGIQFSIFFLFIPSIGWSYHWLFYAFLKAIFWNTDHINKNANFFGTITTKTFSLFIFSFFQKHIALAFSKSNFLRGKIWELSQKTYI